MKKIPFALIIPVLFTLVLACKKSNDPPPASKPVISVDSLLTANTWQVQHITFVASNTLYTYNRGASGNTANFDRNYLIFRKDSTGNYIDGSNNYNIRWKFTDNLKSTLQYTIYNYSNGAPATNINQTNYLENVNITDSTFKYAEIYTKTDGNSIISSVTRTPAANIPIPR